jgi:predicted lipoprotein with Yx(FWY)xxD motif
MKRTLLVVLLAVLGGSSLAGGAVVPTVKTAKIDTLGSVVVNSTGRTLYHYTDEAKGKGKVDCTGACAKLWPPLLLKSGAKPVAGAGIAAAKLGVLKRPDGTFQVTYGGLALYRYSGDTKAGTAKGEALESSWYAVTPAARIAKPSAAAAGSAGGSSSGTSSGSDYGSTTTPGMDSGYGY